MAVEALLLFAKKDVARFDVLVPKQLELYCCTAMSKMHSVVL